MFIKRISKARGEPSGFASFSYRLLGKKLDRLYPSFSSLKANLTMANMSVGLRFYVCQMFFVSFLSAVGCFGVFLTLNMLMPSLLSVIFPFSWAPLLTLAVFPVVVGVSTFLIQYSLPGNKARARRTRIEDFLHITSSYMAVLACAGMGPEKIIRSVAAEESRMPLCKEVEFVVTKMDLLGCNILTALDEEVRRSPSVLYANMLRGFAYTVRTGGNLRKFFLKMTSQLLNKRYTRIQQFLHSLDMLAETYVIMFAVFPLLLIIMFSLMSSVGGSLGGFDLVFLMYLLTFFILPIMASFYILLIDLLQPKG
jgi:flagellar protein FlaJ